ncbi:DUF4476 domain-containing protein, partial [bacterium]|nr:DUF4476 domain-containing protein [bacterium]
MKKLFVFSVLMIGIVTLLCAEGVNFNLDVDDEGAAVSIKTTQSAKKVNSSSKIKEETDSYKMVYTNTKDERTLFEIVEPEGATVIIYNEKGLSIHKAEIPTSKQLASDRYYKIYVKSGDKKFIKKFKTKAGMVGKLWVKSLIDKKTISVKVNITEKNIKTKSEEVVTASDCAMDTDDFSDLISEINDADFSDDKINVIKTAADDNCFSVDQIKKVLKLLEYEDDK